MTQRRFTDAQEKELVGDYLAGMSLTAVATKHDCHFSTVVAALDRAGIARRPMSIARTGKGIRQFSAPEERDVLKRWNAGEAQASIGKTYGAHQVTIGRLLRRLGAEPVPRKPRRERHGSWKGGRSKTANGYVLVLSDEFPSMRNAAGYILEHRLVMARKRGRPLRSSETVHHKNGDRADNRLKNLELHIGRHGTGATRAHCRTCTCFVED